MYRERLALYQEIEKLTQSRLLVYVTGDRRNQETVIASEVLDFFAHHLDAIGVCSKLSLYLYTRGGQTLAAWSIASMLRQYCDSLEVIVPSKAHSAGTLICLGADHIVMTRSATLGPIDPSVNTPLNPSVPGGPPGQRVPVSVEAINGFVELAKQTGVTESADFAAVLGQLTAHVHPLVLGEVFRTRSQIRMLGKRLLARHMSDEQQIEKILSFLCSESGSHDYTVFYQEARDDLGLSVDVPNDPLYNVVRQVGASIAAELQLSLPYDPSIEIGTSPTKRYSLPRALIESIPGGSHRFLSEGMLTRPSPPQPGLPETITDVRSFEGWRYERPTE